MQRSDVFADGALAGRAVLVTAAGPGHGRTAAAELRRCGAEVVICGRRADVLAATAAELGLRHVAGDVREDADAERIVRFALARCGRLDALVNNGGGQYFHARGGDRAEGLARGDAVQCRRDRADDAARRRARVPSGARRHGRQRHALAAPRPRRDTHSSAARAAVEGFTRALARGWAEHGIAVIAVAAGHFDTASLRKYPESIWRAAARTVALQRLGREHEHAWLVVLCCSPLGAALSGSVVTLDGARDDWFGPWPPPSLAAEGGEIPTEERGPKPPGS